MLIQNTQLKNLKLITQPGVITTGLVLYLDAGNYLGSGTSWPATVGPNAQLYNNPTWDGNDFVFAPSNLQYAETDNLGDISNWTVEAWFKATQDLSTIGYEDLTSVVTTVYAEDSGVVPGVINYCLSNYDGVNVTPRSNMYVGFYTGGNWHTTSGPTITPNTWYQVVGTWDGTNLSIYSSGALVNNSQPGGYTTTANGGNTRIARRWDSSPTSSPEYFPGDVAIVRIYDRALTSDEITQNFNANRSRFGI